MAEREAVLRLDEQWARVRSGAAHAPPQERERLLDELIGALRTRPDDAECTALLGLRLADRAALRFAEGDRASALATIEEGLRSSERAAACAPEFARWYARGLINHGVWLAWPLSDGDRLPRHPLGTAASQGPSAMERAAGERALDLTRAAVEVWAGLDQGDPVNRRGLAQAKVFLGDRLAELGHAEEAVAWAVDAECDFRRQLLAEHGSQASQEAEEALDHIGRQLELRLRYLSFDSLTALRARGLLPERLLPQAVVAARVQGVEEAGIAAGLRLEAEQVRTMLEVTPWTAVWRVEVRGPDGVWAALEHPWHSATEVRDRTAADVGAEVVRGFTESADHPGRGRPWRILLWWHQEGDPAGARFRLSAGGDAPPATPS
ncbi:hypothetical protein AMK16_12910 [Streptomyces sp. CB00455]|uniref:hypothetical protein n=1 Tax=Streptomyces sp. CB00455 TaxID=1703927 RepID=UPI0009396386|nr:hypothetical protein [Streptomyces sp. CB00455]OKK19065.1 hypothetical protein AMK16_12910 [Streptomyces sp. CB00455]